MNKVILADSQAIFRAGTAKVLAMDEDLRIIAQCTDLDRMMHAITTFPGSIVVFAASLRPDMARVFAKRSLGFALSLRHIPFDDDFGIRRNQKFISQSFRWNQAQRRAQCAAGGFVVAFVRPHMGRRAQQHEGMMADPVGRRHVFTTFLVLAQIVGVVRARTEKDSDFIAVGQPTALQRRVVQTIVAVES